jgi:hypothetical protein
MSEEIENKIVEKLAEKVKPINYDSKLDSLREKLDLLADQQKHNHEHVHAKGDKPMKHEHKTHSWDKTCVDCGEDNPDYDSDQYQCVDCDGEMGNKTEAEKAKACPHCSSDEGAYNEKEGFSF